MFKADFQDGKSRRDTLSSYCVVPEWARCVQCGICSFNCPLGIDVRGQVWKNQPIVEQGCFTCGECIARCPRGVLRFEPLPSITMSDG